RAVSGSTSAGSACSGAAAAPVVGAPGRTTTRSPLNAYATLIDAGPDRPRPTAAPAEPQPAHERVPTGVAPAPEKRGASSSRRPLSTDTSALPSPIACWCLVA